MYHCCCPHDIQAAFVVNVSDSFDFQMYLRLENFPVIRYTAEQCSLHLLRIHPTESSSLGQLVNQSTFTQDARGSSIARFQNSQFMLFYDQILNMDCKVSFWLRICYCERGAFNSDKWVILTMIARKYQLIINQYIND